MRIDVCCKIVRNLDSVPIDNIEILENGLPDTRFLKAEWNCFDESALELALLFRDKSLSQIHLGAVTIDGTQADSFLKTLYALRYDEAVRITPPEGIDMCFRPEAVAEILAQYFEKKDIGLIFVGWQSGLGNNAQTAQFLAEYLHIPLITQVTDVAEEAEGVVKVTNLSDEGEQIQTIYPPCVLLIGNSPHSILRTPTLKDKLLYGKKEIQVISDEYQLLPSKAKVENFEWVNQKRLSKVVEGETITEKAENLYKLYMKKV